MGSSTVFDSNNNNIKTEVMPNLNVNTKHKAQIFNA